MRNGNRKEAIESYRRSLELDPDYPNAARMLERLSGGIQVYCLTDDCG